MIHVVLTFISLILGALAAMSAAPGFWTGCFVGAVMATSGLKWAKHLWTEAQKAQLMKEMQLAAREAALAKSIAKMEAEKAAAAQAPQASQPTVPAPVVVPPPPPPPVAAQAATVPAPSAPSRPSTVTPKPGPQPLPDSHFTVPDLIWPKIEKGTGTGPAFAAPPN
ncbi:hypothetical protein RQP54_18340 [Curvibacter sp. APW13]|uniref:hypothetical protein n=1 Tax=Curvibacter sp. APW13 TaxID=3077236 RepID=UPI0028DF6EBE|nr:hypothetical protein [Curvibacter sp. APW13]MDT8992839.1 hypothetical protein [Curvibacter sp. APW13]